VTLARRDDDAVDAYVFDAELVDEAAPASSAPRRAMLIAAQGKTAAVITTLRGPAKRTGLAVVRAAWLTGQGGVSCVKRVYSAATHGKLRAQIRAAEAAGGALAVDRPAYAAYQVAATKSRAAEAAERETVAKLEAQLQHAKDARSRRLRELPAVVGGVFAAVSMGTVVLLVVLFAAGVGVWLIPGGVSWGSWWSSVGTVLLVIGMTLQWAVTLAVWAAAPLLLLLLYREGARGQAPTWMLAPVSRDLESVIVTPEGIAAALAHLGIQPLAKAIKDGWRVEFATPPVRVNNCGYAAVFSLPLGVTPEMLADKREVFARNVHRAPLETWPVAAERAGFVDLWVADAGASKRAAPEYPLLHDGAADFFASVPLGVSQRGDVIAPPLMGGNLVFGGMMGQGKSNAARVVMAGAALDPIVELWVFVFAGNGDFDAYAPRLARYERGVDDAVVVAAVDALHALYAEVARREEKLAGLGAKKVTRKLALEHPDLRPIVALFSECHELFGHELGEEAAGLAVQTLRRARKTGIVLAFDTQSSRKDAIPPKIVELVKLNACFAVKSWRSNDGFLGDGSFAAGIRATELRPGKDVGTSVLTGATEERFEILKWFYIEVDDDRGFDAATDIIARSMESVHPAVAVGGRRVNVEVERDLLVDLDAVLGHEALPIADIPALLRGHAPMWPRYRSLTGKALRQWLDRDYGVKVASTGNRWPLDPAAVRAALAARSLDDGAGDE